MSQRVIAKCLFTIKNASFFFPSFRERTIKLLLNEINRLPLDPFSIHCHDFGGRAKRCNKTTHKINSLHKNLLSELVVYHLQPTRSMWWFTLLSFTDKILAEWTWKKHPQPTLASFCQPKLRSWKMAGAPNLCTAHGQPNAVGGNCETRRLHSQDDVLMTYVWVCCLIGAMLGNSVLYSNFGILRCARVSQVPRLPIHVLKGIYQLNDISLTYMEDPHDETWEM